MTAPAWHCIRLALVGLPLLIGMAAAQAYPTRPMRVIASSAAGGLSDVFMRALGEQLAKRWDQPIVLENRPGGNFNIGGRACAEAVPDGYTICLLSNEPLTYNQFLHNSLPFDPENAIAPITNLFFITQAMVVSADLKVKNLPELIALARAKPKTLSYVAPAAPLVLFFETLNKQQGVDIVRVPFKGGGEAVTGVLNGTVPVAFVGIGNTMASIQQGTMVALVVDSEQRSPLLPDVPTLAEVGYRGPVTRSYFGLYAPSGVPKELLAKLAADVRAAAADAGFRDRVFIQRGLEPVLDKPEHFAEFLRRDRQNAKRVVDESGLTPQ